MINAIIKSWLVSWYTVPLYVTYRFVHSTLTSVILSRRCEIGEFYDKTRLLTAPPYKK